MTSPLSILVIGGNAAGPAAAAKAKRVNPSAEVTLIEVSDYISTGTCELPFVLSKHIDDYKKIIFFDEKSFQNEKGVAVLQKHSAEKINRKNKTVIVKNLITNHSFPLQYDRLILATGAAAKKIPNLDYSSENVFTFKTVSDLIKIQEYIASCKVKNAIVVGSSYIGLEVSDALSKIGIDVTIIEKDKSVFPSADPEISELVSELFKKKNIEVVTSASNISFWGDDKRINKVKIQSRLIETDMVISAIGFQPNNSLAIQSNLEIGRTGAIKTNSKMQTSDASIYAAGDCAEVKSFLTNQGVNWNLATIAQQTGHIAGENSAGGNAFFHPIVKNISLKIFNSFYASVGLNERDLANERFLFKSVQAIVPNLVKAMPESKTVFGKIIYERFSKRILGASFFGGVEVSGYADIISLMISAKLPISELEKVMFNYTPPLSPFINPLSVLSRKVKSQKE